MFTTKAIGGEAEQQMRHLLQDTNSGDHLKEMPRSLRDFNHTAGAVLAYFGGVKSVTWKIPSALALVEWRNMPP